MTKINSIFIVDDDPITVFGIKKVLSTIVECNSVSTFQNGKLALDKILIMIENDQQLPEIIFLDINMPVMDGWQFLQEFLELPIKNKIRVNILTSSIDSHDRENWEFYKQKTHHTITYNNKPIRRHEIEEVTKAA